MTGAATAVSEDQLATEAPARLGQRDLQAVLGAMLLTVVVFVNGLTGEFVLDDQKQIARNELIRLPQFWGEALRRDIWAFKGERDQPWSNYWRPGHVAWLIVNYQLFGPRPFFWHVTNLLAHLGVVACAYVVLRWLGATLGEALAIVCIFAIHPTRAESVTWISGGHDVLAALWQLLALACLMSTWRQPLGGFASAGRWGLAVVFYALAISTKEIAIFFPLIVGLIRFTDPTLGVVDRTERLKRSIVPAIPFAVVAALFLILRWFVLRGTQLYFPWQPGIPTIITTLPLVIWFYLRQIFFPYWIGWSYPLRVVTSPGLWNFFIPLLFLVGLIAVGMRIVRGRLAIIGAAIIVLTLLPALNLKAFLPEQIVKDRYLYLPLLGFLMIVVPAAAHFIPSPRFRLAVVAIVVALLGIRTIDYNRAWQNELALWRWAVWSDPTSAFNQQGLGVALMDAKRHPEALEALDRSLAILPNYHDALTARAQLLIDIGRFDEAAGDAQQLIQLLPNDPRGYERLAIAYERQHRLDDAAQVLREAREKVPYRKALFTDMLAVVLVRQGQKAEALAELESVREQAETEFAPGSRMVLFHLGLLYQEQGRLNESAQMMRRFLQLTEGTGDPNLIGPRTIAARALGKPPPAPR